MPLAPAVPVLLSIQGSVVETESDSSWTKDQ
jgi:hypothetical protein